ncbi:MAG: SDR family oxidoreductase [Candidatus Lambdaproteobacteria bacterium]|nr:SDR family oxidoreductase [Candidatus Lambdaproteobacteria bacterium]
MADARVIAVTGASRGIGAAIALELARRGFRVGCLTRGGRGPARGAADPDLARRLRAYPCDVTDEAALAEALRAVVREHGRLDGLVNNAGIHLRGPSERFASADFERVLATNATAVFRGCREAYPHLLASGGGLIVNIGSFFARLGVPHNAAYSASKAAVEALTRCLAVEWGGQGIRVVNVAPGYIETDLNRDFLRREAVRAQLAQRIPAGAPGRPEDVARLVGALFAEDIPFLTGETITLDGGQTIAY